MGSTDHKAIAGHYDAAWNSLALGKTEAGYTFSITHKGEPLTFEEFAQSIVDETFQGTEVDIEVILKEWSEDGIESVMWPWSSTIGKQECVGNFAVAGGFAKTLVLTADSCNPAGTAVGPLGPTVITFHKTIVARDSAIAMNLDNKPRLVPLKFTVFLWDVGTADNRFFTYS